MRSSAIVYIQVFGCLYFVFTFSLDELLDGGLYTGELTEIVGPAGVGKSQVLKCKFACTLD